MEGEVFHGARDEVYRRSMTSLKAHVRLPIGRQ